MPVFEERRMGLPLLLQVLPSRHEDRHGIWVQFIQTKGGIIMIPCIITGAVCVLVSGAIGAAVMALLSFHKLTEYEEEILKLRRRVAELEERENNA